MTTIRDHWLTGVVVACGWAAMVMCAATAAHGQPIILTDRSTASGFECPADRPIRKTVDSGFATCTLVACVGKLICPPNVAPGFPDCYRMPASDCNTCTRSIIDICLSQQELDAAK